MLGRGRAGIVYRRPGATGPMAVKVFIGEPLSDLVNTLLTGAPNPYSWNESAVRCAYYRRRIVGRLVRFWFGDRLSVADAVATEWNADERAWELQTEFVAGHAPALRQPFSNARDPEARDLSVAILPRLQAHLSAAGFDGLLWQAGRGNPVALSNFLVADRRRPARRDADEPTSWSWIDLESGVPALFPADPRALFRDYLPRSLRHGRPLFDDVDTDRLRRYLTTRAAAIDDALGADTAAALCDETIALARHQRAWKSVPRLERGLQCALARRRIDEADAARYRAQPWRWVAHEAGATAWEIGRRGSRLARRLVRAVTRFRPIAAATGVARFLTSATVRERVGRRYVLHRIRHWTGRGQLGRREAGWLRRSTRRHDQATYLSDFAVHLAMKPFYKTLAWLALPLAAQVGLVPLWAVPTAMLLTGAAARTAYTLTRMAHPKSRGSRPWVALWVGMLPVVGAAAYPMQLLAATRGDDGKLAGFLVYDALGSLGRRLPIWGGPDTGAEHASNRLGDLIVRDRGPLLAAVDRG